MLTEDELRVLDRISAAWVAFLELPRCHPDELKEGIQAIHMLQSLVTGRSAVRSHPDRFIALEGFR